MNIRKRIYFSYLRLKGNATPFFYEQFLKEDNEDVSYQQKKMLLIQMINHCKKSVPYYAQIINKLGDSYIHEPQRYLIEFPILTKDLIRKYFGQLKSSDLSMRRWYCNASGGSTGEPVRIIQDQEYLERTSAISHLFYRWAGKEIGESEICLWGSERDLFQGTEGWRKKLYGGIVDKTYLNAFRMTPNKMREFIGILNRKRPKLIVAYAQAIYELARFAQEEKITVNPQRVILACASTLYQFMRESIENVFQCPVFNLYGSREVSAIACQCRFLKGLHVPPWGNYVEIVDDAGMAVPDGVEGNVLVTSLTNFAMPLLRYQIGDRAILSAEGCPCGRRWQMLDIVSGRITDNFKTKKGKVVPGEYFIHLIGVVLNKGQLKKLQIIQKSYGLILLKIVKIDKKDTFDATQIINKIRFVMEEPCNVEIEFVEDIPEGPGGKYRYTISEIH